MNVYIFLIDVQNSGWYNKTYRMTESQFTAAVRECFFKHTSGHGFMQKRQEVAAVYKSSGKPTAFRRWVLLNEVLGSKPSTS